MLHDLTKDDDYATLKAADEERKGWRYRGMVLEICCTAEDYNKRELDAGPVSLTRPDPTQN